MIDYLWGLFGWTYCQFDLANGPFRLRLTRWVRTGDFAAVNEAFQLVNQFESDGWTLVRRNS